MKRLAILTVAVALLAVCGIGSGMVSAEAPVDPHAPLDVVARHGMVAAAHPLAAQAGVDVMKAGGNAIDAADSQRGGAQRFWAGRRRVHGNQVC